MSITLASASEAGRENRQAASHYQHISLQAYKHGGLTSQNANHGCVSAASVT
jgi:hypothetical protein